MNEDIVLALGSNIPPQITQLSKAIQKLKENNIEIKKISSIYQSKAHQLDENNANDFANIVCSIKTQLSPAELLKKIQEIEISMGRHRIKGKVISRIIDIDIILFQNQIINNNNLIIPHPHYLQRDFVLIPLQEILPQYKKYRPNINTNLQKITKNI